ncbi:TPA: flagellin lysine-N-methylase [Clostridium perfringens]|nr:flagellin lysine-N-methylase [Clostridium perfringens]EJT5927229.1 flagellin lysine-N-methylase [Clostridium perfringens]EJT6484011.1 flagellin lysine-N-methylase [Clostridium perfringens]BDA22833.1 flagellar biosynthesis protein [Clostridium perfringens]HBI7119262.1 flagellin lysine-N-methylase [Clostridium perfringens]
MKNIKMRYPIYLKEFKCIGGECEDSCCIGWDVDIDKFTFQQYESVSDSDMKNILKSNLIKNKRCQCDEIDFAKVKLGENKRCPFLKCDNYCVIHSNLGEEYLSNVCTSFPRVTNKIDGIYEMSLAVACPEAARILLLKKDGIEFSESDEDLGKHIVSSEVNTKLSEEAYLPVEFLKEIRETSIKIMKNRKFSLDKRLYILGEFINALEDEYEYNYHNTLSFIREYDIDTIKDSYEENSMNYVIQVDFFKKLLTMLRVEKDIDSDRFKEYSKEVKIGLNLDEENYLAKNAQMYIKAFEEYEKEFIEENTYIFENYIVNFIYSNLFPFCERESIFDSYIMLLIRYTFMRFYLVGMYIYHKKNKEDFNKSLSKKEVVRFIQCFSKVVEHHKTYLIDLLNYIKEHDFNNLEFVKTLLPALKD